MDECSQLSIPKLKVVIKNDQTIPDIRDVWAAWRGGPSDGNLGSR